MKKQEKKIGKTHPHGTFILKNDPWDIQEVTITDINIRGIRSFVEFEFICNTEPSLYYCIPELYIKILDEEEIKNKDLLVENIIKKKNMYDYCLLHGFAVETKKLENSYYVRGYFHDMEKIK